MWRYSNFLVGFQDLLLKQQKLPIYWWFIAPRKIAKLEMVDPIDIPTLFGLPSGNQKWQSKIHHLHIPSQKKNSICRECPVATFDDTGGYRPWVFYDPILIHITPQKKTYQTTGQPPFLHGQLVCEPSHWDPAANPSPHPFHLGTADLPKGWTYQGS